MTEPFIFIATFTLKEGTLEDFKRYWPEFVDFVEESEPRLIAFNAYVSEDGTEVGIVQVHPDVDSMEFHMKLIREHVEHAFAEFLDQTTGTQIYGAISDSALEVMRQLAGPVPLTVKPHVWAASPAPLRSKRTSCHSRMTSFQKRLGTIDSSTAIVIDRPRH